MSISRISCDSRPETDSISSSSLSSTTTISTYYGTGSLAARALGAVGSALLSGLDHLSISRRLANARATIPHRNECVDKGLDDMYSDLFELVFRYRAYPRKFSDQAHDLLVTQVRWRDHKHTLHFFRNLARWPRDDITKLMEKWPTDCSEVIISQLSSYTDSIPVVPKTEFQIPAEIYILTHGNVGVTTRKLRKKDPVDEKLRGVQETAERPRWLNLAKSLTGSESGQWKPALCKLFDEGDSVLLTIILNGTSVSCQTLNIRSLNQTDIRSTDDSLFSRPDCLGIYPNVDDEDEFDPVHLHFGDADARETWLALLRSYALPETYGRDLFPDQGGLYRMWRQIDLSIIQGRNLSTQVPFPSDPTYSPPPSGNAEVSCDLYVNDILCGRTAARKGDSTLLGNPEWYQSFVLPDFGPLENLDIVVWQDKKPFSLRSRTRSISGHGNNRKQNATVIGVVSLPLGSLRRGELCEGWFPVIHSGSSQVQKGELRLKIKIEEEIILPSSAKAYSDLLSTLDSLNMGNWLKILDDKLQMRMILPSFTSLALARNMLLDQLFEAAKKEVGNSSISQSNTMFRGNSTFNKMVEDFMRRYGRSFMRLSIGPVIERICAEQTAIEVNPSRQTKTSARDVERNGVKLLVYWCRELWRGIYSAREECPNEIRQVLEYIRKLVTQHYRISALSALDARRKLPLQSVSSFFFLRFYTPAILNPHRFGLCPNPTTPAVQRSLTLIAKVIQSIANFHHNSTEDYMRGVQEYFDETLPSMTDYLIVVSTSMPVPINASETNKLEVTELIRSHTSSLPILYQDSVQILPKSIDTPKQLALITSAMIRCSRAYESICEGANEDADCLAVQNLFERCFAVEEQALQSVAELAEKQGFIQGTKI